jgi:nitrite reductase (NADH) large subunit
VHLTSYFDGKSAADLALAAPEFFTQHGITLLLDDQATAIDRDARLVRTRQGRALPYDRIVLATGSYAFVPPVPGKDRPGCFVYRTIEDLEAIQAASASAKVGAVVGGGLLGLEAAKALKDLGLTTHVVEFAPRLMAVQIDESGARMLHSRIKELGVGIHTARSTTAIVDGDACRHRMSFADGSELQADIVVFSAGIRPRDELARGAGRTVGERGGIAIDAACRSSDPDIYAVGECALWNGRIYGLVAPGYQMAAVAAARLAGDDSKTFAGADMSTKLKLMGVDVASIGDAHGAAPGARSCSFADERRQVYKKLVMTEDGTRLTGAILVGDAEDYGTLLQLMQNQMPLPENPEQLILPGFSDAPKPVGLGIAALPDTAQVCSCNNVSKGDVCAAVGGGCTTLGAHT